MKVIINGISDVTADVLRLGAETARADDIIGTVAASREIVLSSPRGLYSAFSPDGIFNPDSASFIDAGVEIYNDDDDLIFAGVIYDLRDDDAGDGTTVTVYAREAVGAILDVAVEVNDKTTHAGFALDGDHGGGTSLLKLTGGVTTLPEIAVLTYNENLVPSHQVTTPSGTPTDTIYLLPPLTEPLSSGTQVVIATPLTRTIPGALREGLSAALALYGQDARLDTEAFDALDAVDTASGYLIWMYIRKEDNITLGDHMSTLLRLGDILVFKDANGRITCRRGPAWDGVQPVKRITPSEIIAPLQPSWDRSRLIWAYNGAYVDGDKIKFASYNLTTEPQLARWKPKSAWTPISPAAEMLIGNNYLYNDEITARYYCGKRLDYYSHARVAIRCGLQERDSDGNLYAIALYDQVLITVPNDHGGNDYTEEPGIITAFTYNEDAARYDGVIVELTNYPSPML